MKYQINADLLESGMREALKSKINILESKIESGSKTEIEVAVGEYIETSKIARSFLINTLEYDDYFLGKEIELKERYGIIIK